MLKFSCEKTLLQQAVSTVSRAVAAKSSIPALEGVLLEGDTQLTLSGYNMQTGIRTAISAEIHQEGRIVLNARLFGALSCPDCPPTTIRSCPRWTMSSPCPSSRIP